MEKEIIKLKNRQFDCFYVRENGGMMSCWADGNFHKAKSVFWNVDTKTAHVSNKRYGEKVRIVVRGQADFLVVEGATVIFTDNVSDF